MPWEWPAGAALAFVIAVATTPAGVSGAVLLLPVQLAVLHVPNPAVTPTNLLYNVMATPGALFRFGAEGRLRSPLTRLLLAGTLPGVVVGAVVRVEWLAGPREFLIAVSLVLLPLGLWLLAASGPEPARARRPPDTSITIALAAAVGVIGGIYGLGGGSLIAPVLIALGYPVRAVAPAALTTTFLTSIVGVATFQALQLRHGSAVAPDWALGAALGLGGLAGSYVGARLQSHIPERGLRRLLGVVTCLVAGYYAWHAIHHPSRALPRSAEKAPA